MAGTMFILPHPAIISSSDAINAWLYTRAKARKVDAADTSAARAFKVNYLWGLCRVRILMVERHLLRANLRANAANDLRWGTHAWTEWYWYEHCVATRNAFACKPYWLSTLRYALEVTAPICRCWPDRLCKSARSKLTLRACTFGFGMAAIVSAGIVSICIPVLSLPYD